MTANNTNIQQTRDPVHYNIDNTSATTVTAVNAEPNAEPVQEMKKLLAVHEKRAEEQEKLIGSLS